jgi:hypothetical protein
MVGPAALHVCLSTGMPSCVCLSVGPSVHLPDRPVRWPVNRSVSQSVSRSVTGPNHRHTYLPSAMQVLHRRLPLQAQGARRLVKRCPRRRRTRNTRRRRQGRRRRRRRSAPPWPSCPASPPVAKFPKNFCEIVFLVQRTFFWLKNFFPQIFQTFLRKAFFWFK